MRIDLPYDTKTVPLTVGEQNLEKIVISHISEASGEGTQEEMVRRALEQPVGTPRLRELARGKKRVVLVTSDHTRAVPSKITLPILLGEIRAGNPGAEITILIATGLHRETTREEQICMFGAEIVERERIVVNRAFEKDEFVSMGELPSGAGFYVNRLAVDCDLLVTEGFIEPHFFAGFSGGRKSILPGICSAETVNENHSYKAIASPFAAAGVLEGNPIHEDMICAARRVNVQFILNVALNARKEIIAAFAGDVEAAHLEGCRYIRSISEEPAVTGDIVVTSNGGYPLDQNLYQSPKAVATAEACAGEDGVIIMVCACREGIGGSHFEELIMGGNPQEIDRKLSAVPPRETIPEQWCAQIYARILQAHPVILVTTYLDPEVVRRANMIPASTPDEALAMAFEMRGKDARVVVIPDGVSVMITKPVS